MRFKLRKRHFPISVPPYKKRILSTCATLSIFIGVLIIGFYLIDFGIRPTLINLAETRAEQIAVKAISEAIRSDISPKIKYQTLIFINFDKSGKVSFLQPNTGEINRISAETSLAVQRRLKDLPKQTIKIPVGQIFGSRIGAGFGPDLPVKIFPLGVVESTIADSFDVAGINQIRHRIYVAVKVKIRMVVPMVDRQIGVNARVPLVEAVVMGEVPNIYVGSGGLILPGGAEKK